MVRDDGEQASPPMLFPNASEDDLDSLTSHLGYEAGPLSWGPFNPEMQEKPPPFLGVKCLLPRQYVVPATARVLLLHQLVTTYRTPLIVPEREGGEV